ncbi:uncharacterized protein LOC111359658 [Spodoptera litura]|uniref:Uncharacterized protein LOC111359658 n=1 Tax=Spodoptera litura TaxID=69820 RepID=A0A9J7EMB1_SPOLT|nr:uncharacterized protein LOC111359658 [Spodoptera litura]
MNEININIEGYNVNGICVGCLNYNRRMFYNSDIKECFRLLGNIDVPDGLEIQVCWECLARVKSAIRFRKQILQSYDFLIKYSKEHTFLDSPHDFEPHATKSLLKTEVFVEQVKEVKEGVEDEKEVLVKDEEHQLEYTFGNDERHPSSSSSDPEDTSQNPLTILWEVHDNENEVQKISDPLAEDESNHSSSEILFKVEEVLEGSNLNGATSPTLELLMPSSCIQSCDTELSPKHIGIDSHKNSSTSDKRTTRKRVRHTEEWQDVKRKRLRNLGKKYITKKGKEVDEKSMGAPCKCHYKCYDRISEEQRLECFQHFWQLGDRVQQWHFIIKYTEKMNKKRCTNIHIDNRRKYTFKYYLPILAGSSEATSSSKVHNSSDTTISRETDCEKTAVCQIMFINTLAISDRIIKTAWAKNNGTANLEDRRGRHGNRIRKKISVCEEIQMDEKPQEITTDISELNNMSDPLTEDVDSNDSSTFSLEVSQSMENSQVKLEKLIEDALMNESTSELLVSTPIPSPANSESICDSGLSLNLNTKVDTTKKSSTSDKRTTRKRVKRTEEWRDVKRKRLRNLGKKYITKKGKEVDEKSMGAPCECHYKCYDRISEEQRLECFKQFWQLGDRVQQWHFIIKYTEKMNKKSCTNIHINNRRKYTFKYYLPILAGSSEATSSKVPNSNDTPSSSETDCEKIAVCQIMFINTLAISDRIIKTAWAKNNGTANLEDRRGRHGNRIRKKISVCEEMQMDEETLEITTDISELNNMSDPLTEDVDSNDLSAFSLEVSQSMENPQIKLEKLIEDALLNESTSELSVSTPIPSPANSESICDSGLSLNLNTKVDTTKKSSTSDKRTTRKRVKRTEEWRDVKRKRLRNLGKKYITKKGKEVDEKSMGAPCECHYKCYDRISEEQRLECFKQFWQLGDRVQQWHFIIKYTEKMNKKRCMNIHIDNRRKYTFKYYLPILAASSKVHNSSDTTSSSETDCEKIAVCQIMFINTLAISGRIIKTAWAKNNGTANLEDRRGRHGNHRVIKNTAMENSVCDHVRTFTPSRSLRRKSQKIYLKDLNLTKMFKLYLNWFDPKKYLIRNVDIKEEALEDTYFEDIPGKNEVSSDEDVQLSKLKEETERDKKRKKSEKKKQKLAPKKDKQKKEKNVEKKNRKLKNLPGDLVELYTMSNDEMWVIRWEDLNSKEFQKLKYRCDTCIIAFNTEKLMQDHLNGKHQPKGENCHQCPICEAYFLTKDNLSAHKALHQQGYKCKECGFNTGLKKRMMKHVGEHKTGDSFTCSSCGSSFRVIHDGLSYPCPICGKLFQWKRNLYRHTRNHRERAAGALHECRDCGKTFASRDCYNNHMRLSKRHVADEALQHACTYCDKKFPTKWCLTDHVDWDHLKRIKYQCSSCFKPFKTAKILVAHVKNIHEGKKKEVEGEHLCEICGKSYRTVKRLKGHVWAMHTKRSNSKVYKCKLCPATFMWQTSIYKHMKMMHDNKKAKTQRAAPPVKKEEPYPGIELANRMQYFQQNLSGNLNIVHIQPIEIGQNIVFK